VDDFPDDPSRGSHFVKIGKEIYIDISDFGKTNDKSYRRLTEAQTVGLKYAGLVVKVSSIKYRENSTEIEELFVKAELVNDQNKPKAFIHWVSEPVPVQVNIYATIFNKKEPESDPNGFLSDINRNSLTVMKSFADSYLLGANVRQCYQFERAGFFCVDDSSTKGNLVFNETVTLKGNLSKS